MTPHRRRRRRIGKSAWGRAAWLTLLASPTAGGCFRYVPVDAASVRPEEEVRVQVAPSAGGRVAQERGTYTTTLEGLLTLRGPDSLSLSLPLMSGGRESADGLRQTFFLGRGEIVSVERRQVDKAKTAVVTIGALVAAGAFVTALSKGTLTPEPGDDGSGPITVSRSPRPGISFRIPIP